MVSKNGRGLALPFGLALGCVVLFFALFIRPGLEDLGRTSLRTSFDYQSFFLPRFALGSLELFRGHLPTWNAYEYGGIPLLATSQPAALYLPKALIFGLFPAETAIWVFLIFHYVLLVGFFLVFLRSQGITGTAAFVGVAVWAFESPMLLASYAPTRIANLVWMPLFFVFAERLGRGGENSDGRKRAFAWLALVVGIQLTAGYPEVTMDTGLLLAVHATAAWATGRWPLPPWKTVPVLALAFVLGALAAAAQLAPLGELALVAQRARLGSNDYRDPFNLTHTLLTVIPGLIPFTLVGLFLRRARVAAAGMVTCWVVSGGGWMLLRRLPGFSMIRFPLAWVYLAALFFAWLAAHGVDAILRSDGPEGLAGRARTATLAMVSASGLAILAICVQHWPHLSPGAAPVTAVTPLMTAATELPRYLSSFAAWGLAVAGATLLVAVAVHTALAKRVPPPSPTPWLVAVLLLTLSHLAAYPFGSVPAPLSRPLAAGQIATLHGRPRSIRGRVLSLEDLLYGYEITDRLPSPLGIEFSFLPHRYRMLLDRLKFIPLFAQLDWPLLFQGKGFLDAMDVEFLATPVAYTELAAVHSLQFVRQNAVVSLFHNPDSMGHAWVNYAVRPVASREAALEYVLSGHFDPHQEVLLEEAPRHSYPLRTTESVTVPLGEHRRSATDVEFAVALDRAGFLVVSESAYPGWEATVDGVPTPWLGADYVLRAVELEPGYHHVRFEYRPASLRWGLRGSAAGLLLIGGLFLRRRSPVTRVQRAA